MEKRRYYSLPWNEWYRLACIYYNKHGNLLIPSKYETDVGYKLGKWIERQRFHYRRNSHVLTDEKKELLEKIKMEWCLENRYSWDFWMRLCQKFKEEFGHLNMTNQYIYDGICLGEWLSQQKKKYKHGLLSDQHIQELIDLGVQLKTNDYRSWNEWFEIAEKYYNENGDLNVKVHQVDEKGNKIGVWVYMQREKYRHKRLPALLDVQIEKLNSIHIKW